MKKEEKKYKPKEQEPPVISEPVVAYTSHKIPPCQYTIEELRERIIQGMEDYKAGNYYDAEEVMKDWDKWADE